jgi:hypothetical protein
MTTSVTPTEEMPSTKQARVAAEEAFGGLLRNYIARSGVKFVDVAKSMAIPRNDLYETMDGIKHCRAAWLSLLPPAVERLYLADRAAVHGMELVPVASGETSFADAAPLILATLSSCAASEADGKLEVDECIADLAKIEALEAALAGMKAKRRRAVELRGLSLVTVAK